MKARRRIVLIGFVVAVLELGFLFVPWVYCGGPDGACGDLRHEPLFSGSLTRIEAPASPAHRSRIGLAFFGVAVLATAAGGLLLLFMYRDDHTG